MEEPKSLQAQESEQRNWSELPRDILFIIFQKLGAIEVLLSAQAVCPLWRQFALLPRSWLRINMCCNPSRNISITSMEMLAREAVSRSNGHLEEFNAGICGSDNLLTYISSQTTRLRSLALMSSTNIKWERLIEFLGQFPLLEELEITNCNFYKASYREITQVCSELKCFRLNMKWRKTRRWSRMCSDSDSDTGCDRVWYLRLPVNYDREALEIAIYMPQLRELQLIGNQMTNTGLEAILDKLQGLESLDIRACFYIRVDVDVEEKLCKLKTVRLPNDSTADCKFDAGSCEDRPDGEVDTDLDEELENRPNSDSGSNHGNDSDDDDYYGYSFGVDDDE